MTGRKEILFYVWQTISVVCARKERMTGKKEMFANSTMIDDMRVFI
jgi:hypothetical protein